MAIGLMNFNPLSSAQASPFGGVQAIPSMLQGLQAAYANPMLKQQLAQAIAQSQQQQAKAQYAPMQQLGIGEQQLGGGGTAMAQSKFAPQYFGGQAGQQTGLAQQQLAAGQYAPQQQKGIAQQQLGLGTQQQVAGQYAPQIQRANIAGTTIPALNQALQNLIAAGVAPDMAQQMINQLTQSAKQINPNAPNVNINPSGWLPAGKSNIKPGTVKPVGGKNYIYDGYGWSEQ